MMIHASTVQGKSVGSNQSGRETRRGSPKGEKGQRTRGPKKIKKEKKEYY